MLETKRVVAQKVSSWWDIVTPMGRAPHHPLCVSHYLAVCAIRVADRHKDLWEELLGLLFCVLFLRNTSGCI